MIALDRFIKACDDARRTGGEVGVTSEGVPYNNVSSLPRFMSLAVRWFKERYMPKMVKRERQKVTSALRGLIEEGDTNLEIRHEDGHHAFLEDLEAYLLEAKFNKKERMRTVVWRSYFDAFHGISDKSNDEAEDRWKNFESFCNKIHSVGKYNDSQGEIEISYLRGAYMLSGYTAREVRSGSGQLREIHAVISPGEVHEFIKCYQDAYCEHHESKA